MNLSEKMQILKECKDSMLAIYSTSKIALERLSDEGDLGGYHTGGILRSSKFHSRDAMYKLSRYIENLEKS